MALVRVGARIQSVRFVRARVIRVPSLCMRQEGTVADTARSFDVRNSKPVKTAEADYPVEEPVYTGIINDALMRLKKMCVYSTGACVAGAPVLIAFGEGLPMSVRAGMAFTVCTMSAWSLGMLHFVSKPYVLRLWASSPVDEKERTISATSLNMFGNELLHTFPLSEALPFKSSMRRPLTLFTVGSTPYFVHHQTFVDKELLEALTGIPPTPENTARMAAVKSEEELLVDEAESNERQDRKRRMMEAREKKRK